MTLHLPWFLTSDPKASKLQWQQDLQAKRKLLIERIHLEHCSQQSK